MQVLDNGFIELTEHLGDDNTVVSAARVCTMKEAKSDNDNAKLIRAMFLSKPQHTSPFEQVEFQFLVKCPIFVARQWMRHRTWSYMERSRRYTSDDIEFYIPDELRMQGSDQIVPHSKLLIADIESLILSCNKLYKTLLDNGVCREQARIVLPPNLFTVFYAKTDLHNLFHFLELRDHPHAQKEIRVYAEAIEKLIEPIVPLSLEAWRRSRG